MKNEIYNFNKYTNKYIKIIKIVLFRISKMKFEKNIKRIRKISYLIRYQPFFLCCAEIARVWLEDKMSTVAKARESFRTKTHSCRFHYFVTLNSLLSFFFGMIVKFIQSKLMLDLVHLFLIS